jgi:hypothetical protein
VTSCGRIRSSSVFSANSIICVVTLRQPDLLSFLFITISDKICPICTWSRGLESMLTPKRESYELALTADVRDFKYAKWSQWQETQYCRPKLIYFQKHPSRCLSWIYFSKLSLHQVYGGGEGCEQKSGGRCNK